MSNDNLTTQVQQLIDIARNTDAKIQDINSRLERLETVVTERLYDTRPLWADITPRIEAIDTRTLNIEASLTEVNSGLNELKYLMRAMNDNTLRTQANIQQVEDRVDSLERKAS